MSEDLQCGRCGAPLALPSDFGVWLARTDDELRNRKLSGAS
jgi:hypothetical protein